jgi:uncharacterized protein
LIYAEFMKNKETVAKEEKLESIIGLYESALVAFSGGVDSSYLVFAAYRLLGENMLAVTIDAPWIPRREILESEQIAKELGVAHKVVIIDFSRAGKFFENPQDRCFLCKTGIFSKLREMAEAEGFAAVFEGSNADDASAYRPGIKALNELGIISPLKEAGLTKSEIRELSRAANLSTADKPAYACLASRFPYGTVLTEAGFKRVEQAEDYLFSLGFAGHRVRDHFPIARIELPDNAIAKFSDKPFREKIAAQLKTLGYKFVTLDLEGYRSGCFDPDKK